MNNKRTRTMVNFFLISLNCQNTFEGSNYLQKITNYSLRYAGKLFYLMVKLYVMFTLIRLLKVFYIL